MGSELKDWGIFLGVAFFMVAGLLYANEARYYANVRGVNDAAMAAYEEQDLPKHAFAKASVWE